MELKSPFPYFGGKSTIAAQVWRRLGVVKQYIEPFCGSAAVMLRNPSPPNLEVVNDMNGHIANFWRAVKNQPDAVAEWADYPVSHIDLGARHRWLTEPDRVAELAGNLEDPEWPGDANMAGWWLWGQCCWIGSGWCDWFKPSAKSGNGKIPHASNAGRGVFPVQAQYAWMRSLAARLARVRVCHGDWSRCLNNHYGDDCTAVFLDPPYKAFCAVYGCQDVAGECEAWAKDNARLRVALCGHVGDYDLPGWEVLRWERAGSTYAGTKTKDQEAVWFSPACFKPEESALFEWGVKNNGR